MLAFQLERTNVKKMLVFMPVFIGTDRHNLHLLLPCNPFHCWEALGDVGQEQTSLIIDNSQYW